MARIAPGWMATLNNAHLSASKPSNSVARMRCPVDETGRYSVSPSTTPRMMTSNRIGIELLATVGSGGRALCESPALDEAPEPVARHGFERGRDDPERLEPACALGGDIVALEHDPLVAA